MAKETGTIKRVILGMICGIVLFLLFMFFGGSEYLMKFAKKTEEASIKLEVYEQKIRESAEEAKDKFKGTVEAVEAVGGKIKDAIDTGKETVTKVADKATEVAGSAAEVAGNVAEIADDINNTAEKAEDITTLSSP